MHPQLPPGLVKDAVVVGRPGIAQSGAGVLEIGGVGSRRQLGRQLGQTEVLGQLRGEFRRGQVLSLKPIHPGTARVLGVVAPALGIQLIEEGEQPLLGQKALFVQRGQLGAVKLSQEGQGPGGPLPLKHRPDKVPGDIGPSAEAAASHGHAVSLAGKYRVNAVAIQSR